MRLLLSLAALGAAACQPVRADGAEASEPAAATSVAAEAEPRPATDLTCSGPVRADDSVSSLQARYGGQARLAMLGGPEGSEFEGLVLWPDDPEKRAEVLFADEAMGKVSSVRLSDRSHWRIAGLALGDSLQDVRAANGTPFALWGFEWDYGGYVADLKGGELQALPGGCRVVLRFALHGGGVPPEGILGEGELSSDDARLAGVDARLVELSLAFPEPAEGEK